MQDMDNRRLGVLTVTTSPSSSSTYLSLAPGWFEIVLSYSGAVILTRASWIGLAASPSDGRGRDEGRRKSRIRKGDNIVFEPTHSVLCSECTVSGVG